jgi:Abortive infection alpha
MTDDDEPETSPAEGDQPASLTGVARLAASVWWHTTEWSVGVTARATRRALEVAARPDRAGEVVEDIRQTVRAAARELVGIADLDGMPGGEVARRVADTVVPDSSPTDALESRDGQASPNGDRPLRELGNELLYKSRDVHYEEQAHPAYERLVESLAPDEARILRLLLLSGPQPAVDIRTGGPLGLISSRLLAPGLNMIGARAGCRYVDRVPSYLTNLNRLGLIWFSRETLRDPERYQVLEAQPDVLAPLHSVRQTKIVRRSIHLTPFGEGFCRASLVESDRPLVDLPEHASPEKKREPRPPEL